MQNIDIELISGGGLPSHSVDKPFELLPPSKTFYNSRAKCHGSFVCNVLKFVNIKFGGIYMKKKKAFTLAEVLITIGIIGIIAAMTLPTLVQSHKEKQTVAQLKKFYSVMSNAMMLAYNEYGPLDDWGVTGMGGSEESFLEGNAFKNKFIYNLMPYLKVLSFCEFGDSSCEKNDYSVRSLDGTAHIVGGVKFLPHLVLSDGTTINHLWFSSNSVIYGEIYVDLNGVKAPNTLGVDIFVFGIIENKIIPYGLESVSRFSGFSFDKLCSLDVTNRMNGYGCAAWVIFEENMQYLKCNDLSFDGKKKCK